MFLICTVMVVWTGFEVNKYTAPQDRIKIRIYFWGLVACAWMYLYIYQNS